MKRSNENIVCEFNKLGLLLGGRSPGIVNIDVENRKSSLFFHCKLFKFGSVTKLQCLNFLMVASSDSLLMMIRYGDYEWFVFSYVWFKIQTLNVESALTLQGSGNKEIIKFKKLKIEEAP